MVEQVKNPKKLEKKLAKEAAKTAGMEIPEVEIPSDKDMIDLQNEIGNIKEKIDKEERPGREYHVQSLRDQLKRLEEDFELKTKIRAKAAAADVPADLPAEASAQAGAEALEGVKAVVPKKKPEKKEGTKEGKAKNKKRGVKKPRGKKEKIEAKKKPATVKAVEIKDVEKIETVKLSADEKEKVKEGFEEFNIDTKDLEKIEGFKDLSYGQRMMVLENLNQLTLGRIQEEAQKKYREDSAKATLLGRMWQSVSKQYQIVKHEKATALEIREGGMETSGKVLEQLVKGTREQDLDVVEKEGKLEIQYVSDLEDLSSKEKVQVESFNNLASEFSKMPYEWSLDTASKIENKRYQALKDEYEKSKENILNIKKERSDEQASALYIAEIENKLRTNQFLNTHPEIERQMYLIEDRKAWRRIFQNTVTERGIYFGAGLALRSASTAMIGTIGLPIAAGAMGGYMGRRRAKSALKERAILERKGVKEGEAPERNVVDATALSSKMEFLVNKIQGEKDKDRKIKLLESLRIRIKYTQDKLDDGLVNFGKTDKRLTNQYNLADKLSVGSAFVAAELNRKTKSALEKRLDGLLRLKKRKIKKAQREYITDKTINGALWGAGLAMVGSYIRDVFAAAEVEHLPIETPTDAPVYTGASYPEGWINEELAAEGTTLPAIADAELPPQFDIKPIEVEASSRGAIQTFRDLKEQLGTQYPDLNHAPESVREIIEGDPTKLAIKYGFYDPGSEQESAMIWKGSTLSIDEKGDLVWNDIRTGKISELNLGEKYAGEMFDAGAKAPEGLVPSEVEGAIAAEAPAGLVPSEVEGVTPGAMELTAEQTQVLKRDIPIDLENWNKLASQEAEDLIGHWSAGETFGEEADLGEYLNQIKNSTNISPHPGESAKDYLLRLQDLSGIVMIKEEAIEAAVEAPTIEEEILTEPTAEVAPELAEQVADRRDEMLKAIFGKRLRGWEEIQNDGAAGFMETFIVEPKKEYYSLGIEMEDAMKRHLMSPRAGETVASFFQSLITKDIEAGIVPYILLAEGK